MIRFDWKFPRFIVLGMILLLGLQTMSLSDASRVRHPFDSCIIVTGEAGMTQWALFIQITQKNNAVKIHKTEESLRYGCKIAENGVSPTKAYAELWKKLEKLKVWKMKSEMEGDVTDASTYHLYFQKGKQENAFSVYAPCDEYAEIITIISEFSQKYASVPETIIKESRISAEAYMEQKHYFEAAEQFNLLSNIYLRRLNITSEGEAYRRKKMEALELYIKSSQFLDAGNDNWAQRRALVALCEAAELQKDYKKRVLYRALFLELDNQHKISPAYFKGINDILAGKFPSDTELGKYIYKNHLIPTIDHMLDFWFAKTEQEYELEAGKYILISEILNNYRVRVDNAYCEREFHALSLVLDVISEGVRRYRDFPVKLYVSKIADQLNGLSAIKMEKETIKKYRESMRAVIEKMQKNIPEINDKAGSGLNRIKLYLTN